MPTYSYACTACEHRFDAVQPFTDPSLTDCPECQGRLRKLFSSVGIVFKGSGFYRTDSRADQSNGSGSADKSESGSGDQSGTADKSDKSDKSGSKAGSTEKTTSRSSAGSSTGSSASSSGAASSSTASKSASTTAS